MVAAMARRALAGTPIEVYGDGCALRDFLHVDDAASALIAAADRGVGGAWLVGSGASHSIAALGWQVRDAAANRTGVSVPVHFVTPPATLDDTDTRSVVIDDRRFRAATGWRPRYGFVDGVTATVAAVHAAGLLDAA